MDFSRRVPRPDFPTSLTYENTGKGVADPIATILMLLDWLADQQSESVAVAAIRAVTGFVPASGPKTWDLGGGTVEVTRVIRSAPTTDALAA